MTAEKSVLRLIYNVAMCGIAHNLHDEGETICRTMVDKFPSHTAFRHGVLCSLLKKEQWAEAQNEVSTYLEDTDGPHDMLYSVRIRCHLAADEAEEARVAIGAWRDHGVDEKYATIFEMYEECLGKLDKIA